MDREIKTKKYGIEIMSDEESDQIYFDKIELVISTMCGDPPLDRLRKLIAKINSAADKKEQSEDHSATQ